jgi:hypothetical protein
MAGLKPFFHWGGFEVLSPLGHPARSSVSFHWDIERDLSPPRQHLRRHHAGNQVRSH